MVTLKPVEAFWYILGCIAFGANYFAKIPVKKALADTGQCRLSGWERFWYVLECIPLGAGYFAKVVVKKALSETTIAAQTAGGSFATE